MVFEEVLWSLVDVVTVRSLGPLLLGALCAQLAGCAVATPQDADAVDDVARSDAAASSLPRPSRPSFCARDGSNPLRDVFCAAQSPGVSDLRTLQERLQLHPVPQPGDLDANLPVLLGHSTSLSGRLVSPLNPRAIVLNKRTAMAFQRGQQQVELASRGDESSPYTFYLLTFEQACNASAAGCMAGDLFSPAVEIDWTRVTVRDDEELKNTPSDCRQCHQRGLPSPILLMREVNGPWTHFFGTLSDGEQRSDGEVPDDTGRDLVRDYRAAHGDAPYANIPFDFVRATEGLALQISVAPEQPLVFDAPKILFERWPYDFQSGWVTTPQRSVTWDRNYEAFKRGEQLALPYFAARATDPTKSAQLTAAYQRFRNRELDTSELPDLADVAPDDPQTRAEIGLLVEPQATPAQALIQGCGSCHNDVLDQTISRARFNIALARLDPAERAVAIERLRLSPGSAGAMPPRDARQLDAATRERLLSYLQEDERAPDDDALLEHAATLGMAGPAAL